MKVSVDALLLIYLNTIADSENRIPYENFYLEVLAKHRSYTDVLVLDELIYVSRRKYGIPYGVSMEFVESNVLPYISIIVLGEEEYRQAAKLLAKYNLKPSDTLRLGAMANNSITTIATEDREFDKIPAVERLWMKE